MGKQIYDKPIKSLFKDFSNTLHDKETFDPTTAINWFKKNYPEIKESSVRVHLIRLTTNNPTRIHYGAKKEDDIFYRIGTDQIRRYEPHKDPPAIYIGGSDRKKPRLEPKMIKEIAEKRLSDLIEDFYVYLNYFLSNMKFSGPSVYFHKKVINKVRAIDEYEKIFSDDLFFDYLYATLSSWGMHRMGNKTAKMSNFEDFRQSILDNKEELVKLSSYKLQQLTDAEYREIKRGLSKIFDVLKVMDSDAKLVGNSKALHHLLPDLVVPIDRTHTLRFFFNNTNIAYDEKSLFLELFDRFREIAKNVDLSKVPLDGFNISVPKIIDNAIMGYTMQKLLKSRK
jgi:hypothetical protein